MRARRFVGIFLTLVIAFLAGVAVLNILVDPYDVFGMPRLMGFNARKPDADTHTAMVKAFQVERVFPRTVLVGTSRVDIGLDPDHAAWPQVARPVYNYAFPEASIRMTRQQLQHAAAAGSLRLAMVGLEFQDFLSPKLTPAGEPTEIERRLLAMGRAEPDTARDAQRLTDAISATLTLKALLDSVDTVLRQGRPNLGDVAEHGLTSESPYAGLVRSDGYYDLFTQKDLGLVEAREQAARALSGLPPAEFAELTYVRSVIEFCRDRNIELYLFIPPYHADFLEIIDAIGLWDRFEAWKIALVKLVEEYGSMENSPTIVLWDFASYDDYTTEIVPGKGDPQGTLRWFWEPVHFKKALGDIMLSRMLGAGEQKFGVVLTAHSVAEHLAAERANRAAFRAAHPAEVERIAELIRKVRQRDDRSLAKATAQAK